jgi:hypothetical protein
MGSNNNFARHKRKLSVVESDTTSATSDTSGRFDDADESETDAIAHGGAVDEVLDTRSVHSAKRGRSNGWPLRDELAYDEHGMKIDLRERRSPNKVTFNDNDSPRPSSRPDSSAKDGRRQPSPPPLRVRRSRFIEGSMNDRVSSKPPSVLFQDVPMTTGSASDEKDPRSKANNHGEKRGSGIFRFGKAIASAFHPFGGWGNKSEAGPQDASKAQKELMKHRQVRAEKAYAELKKSGFKGIGAPNAVDSDVADETWNAIQDQMDYKMTADDRATREQNAAAPTPTPTPTPARHETGLSKLKSLSELRKRTSTLNLPSVRHRDVSPIPPPSDRELEDSHRPVQRRQSRKDLSRQAKLLKKVSNLEDKLGRARRELRELASNEEDSTLPSICVDGAHARKFVPGTLPSLPSERLLHDQAEDESGRSTDPGGKGHDHSEPEHRILSSVSPKQPRKLSKNRPSAEDSLSPRKRKSSAELPSNKGSRSDDGGEENHYHHQHPDIDPSNTPRKTSSRQSKSQKTARADSPGGAKSLEPDHTTNGVGSSPRKVKPTRDKRSSSLTTKSSQRLKAKQSSRNLRQVATDDEADGNRNSNKGPFYLQEQHQLDSNILKIPPAPSSPNTKKTTEWEDQDEENIPPVPPVPKELLLEKNTTKMMIGGAKASGGRRLENIDEAKSPGKHHGGGRIPSTGFTWPEDIF